MGSTVKGWFGHKKKSGGEAAVDAEKAESTPIETTDIYNGALNTNKKKSKSTLVDSGNNTYNTGVLGG